MRGLINAVGYKDSLNQNRAQEIRGLVRFGGRPVIDYTLHSMGEIGIEDVLVLVNKEHKDAYKKYVNHSGFNVEVREYEGNPAPLVVYHTGVSLLRGDDVLIVADDNLFDFDLEGLVDKFHEVDNNTLVVRKMDEDLNFGRCTVDEEGRITSASYSFAPDTKIEGGFGVCDIYLIHKKRINEYLDFFKNKTLKDANNEWFKDFYAWEAKEGFWADIGKPELRKKAEEYYEKF